MTRSSPFLRLFFILVPAIVVAVAHCGGTTSHTQAFPDQHVAVAPTCDTARPPGIVDAGAPAPDSGIPPQGNCRSDSDCTMGKNGRCAPQGRIAGDYCTYDSCFTDGDCAPGQACMCSASGNACLNANCRTDGDCAGLGCSPTYGMSCGSFGGTQGFYCHTSSDDCVNDKDCTQSGAGYCAFSPQVGHWQCFYGICAG